MRLLLFLLLILPLGSRAQRLPAPARLNLAGLYRPHHVPQAEVRREGDSVRVFVRFPEAATLRAGQPLHLLAWTSYDARQPTWQDSVRRWPQRLRRVGTEAWLDFTVPAAQLETVRVLAVWPGASLPDNPGAAAWLPLSPALLSRPYLLTDSTNQPLLRRYARVGETVRVATYGEPQPVKLRGFPADFEPALPPHASPAARPASKARTLTPIYTGDIAAGQGIRFAGTGLYTMQLAGRGAQQGMLVLPADFPELLTAESLIDPLRYLTTTEERQRLLQAEVPKRAVDNFWLKAANNEQDRAKRLIREFYGRVIEANLLFTAHKPGWMTDRGLLYVVVGPPDRVERTAGGERWSYERSGGGSYLFRAKPSTFAADYYELVRRAEHEQLWYRAVEQWRTGLTAPPEAGR